MIEVDVKIDWRSAWNAMDRAVRRVPGTLTRLVERHAYTAMTHSQNLATAELYSSANYNASFEIEVGRLQAVLRNLHPAAHFLEHGTSTHLIFPRGKALRWIQHGKYVFSRWAVHPGTRPYRFVQRGIEEANRRVELLAQTLGRELIE